MLRIGKFNNLRVVKTVDFGVYLDGGEYGEILMPRKYVPEGLADGGEVEAFVYFDSEDRIIATTERPLIEVGEFGMLTAGSLRVRLKTASATGLQLRRTRTATALKGLTSTT